MPRKCSICSHNKRCQIDECLLNNAEYSGLARKFRVSEDALKRHVDKGHVSKVVKAAVIEKQIEHGLNLHKCAQEIYDIATGSAMDARQARMFNAVGSCLTPAAKVLEILNKESKPSDNKGIAAIHKFNELIESSNGASRVKPETASEHQGIDSTT